MAAGTNGGGAGTGGGRSRRAWLITAAALLLSGSVNALSAARDRPAGRWWEPWCWEMTSAVFWIAMLVPLWRLARHLRPPRRGWGAGLALLLALTPLVTLLHAAWFDASRSLVYALAGLPYAFDWRPANLLYEWRKDVLSVLALTGLGHVIDQMRPRDLPAPPPPPPPYRLEVRDGARTLFLAPAEISHAEAAGNYVELHTASGPVLHRITLAALEQELGPHGFARIHRSRLVRRDAVTAIATTPSGDFTVTLAGGAELQGSRRFRSQIGA